MVIETSVRHVLTQSTMDLSNVKRCGYRNAYFFCCVCVNSIQISFFWHNWHTRMLSHFEIRSGLVTKYVCHATTPFLPTWMNTNPMAFINYYANKAQTNGKYWPHHRLTVVSIIIGGREGSTSAYTKQYPCDLIRISYSTPLFFFRVFGSAPPFSFAVFLVFCHFEIRCAWIIILCRREVKSRLGRTAGSTIRIHMHVDWRWDENIYLFPMAETSSDIALCFTVCAVHARFCQALFSIIFFLPEGLIK